MYLFTIIDANNKKVKDITFIDETISIKQFNDLYNEINSELIKYKNATGDIVRLQIGQY